MNVRRHRETPAAPTRSGPAPARLDRRTKDLTKRLQAGDIAVINNGTAVSYTPGGDLVIKNGGMLQITNGSFTQVIGNNYIQLNGNGSILVNGSTVGHCGVRSAQDGVGIVSFYDICIVVCRPRFRLGPIFHREAVCYP